MRLLIGIAVLTVMCMFTVALVTDRLANSFLATGNSVPSSRIHLINDVTQALKRAQDYRGAYLTTGDPSYLQAYHIASTGVDATMDRLVSQDKEVSNKLTHVEDLREFVHEKLAEIGRSLEAIPQARTAPKAASTDEDLQRIQKLLDSLGQEEARDFTSEMEATRARATFHRNLVIALAAINVLFLVGVTFCAVQIGKLHSLVTMCAWSKRVHYEGKWIPLEEYMRKRFGIRISHGISEEEYEKWAAPEMAEVQAEDRGEGSAPAAQPHKAA